MFKDFLFAVNVLEEAIIYYMMDGLTCANYSAKFIHRMFYWIATPTLLHFYGLTTLWVEEVKLLSKGHKIN